AIATDSAGNSYVTGFLQQGGAFGGILLTNPYAPFIVKYDSAGNVQWAKQPKGDIGGQGGHGVAVDMAGNCYVAGDMAYNAAFDSVTVNADVYGDIFVTKIGFPPINFIQGDNKL